MAGPWEKYGAQAINEEKKPWEKYQVPVEEPISEKPEDRGFLEKAAGVGEAALAIGTAAVAEPIAGWRGAGVMAAEDATAGTEAIKETREALTYQPRTEAGKEYMQDIGEAMQPIGEGVKAVEDYLADIGYAVAGDPGWVVGGTIPAATLELLGLKGAYKIRGKNKITGIPDDVADDLADKGVEIDDLTPEGVAKVQEKTKEKVKEKAEEIKPPEQKQYEDILANIKANKAKKVAGEVMPDKEIMDAAESLGIDLNPSHYSTNKAYMEVEQSLKSRPGSTLSAKELKAMDDLSTKADEMIREYGGTTDKSLLDAKVKSNLSSTISDLESKATTFYNKIGDKIPPSTLVSAPASSNYINKVVEDLGGDIERLSPAEKDLYKLSKKDAVTYAALDRLRKDIGRGFKKQGVYKDEDSGLLKQAYRQISDDQQKIAEGFGVGDDYALARKLVGDRKKIEDQAKALFGREVSQSIVPKMKLAASSLTKGDVSKFEKLMDSLPKDTRSEAAVSLLGNIFVQDARSATGLSQGFVNAFDSLNRNKSAKNVLFKHLPIEARNRFNMIGKVATGLYKAKSLENKSKTARDLISAMDDGGMFKRVLDTGGKVAAAEGVTTSIGVPGAGAAGVIGSIMTRGKRSASEAADEFIASKKFSAAIKEAAEGNVKNAEEMIKKSPQYKKWIKFADKGDVAAITTVGFIPWLTGQTGQENEQ